MGAQGQVVGSGQSDKGTDARWEKSTRSGTLLKMSKGDKTGRGLWGEWYGVHPNPLLKPGKMRNKFTGWTGANRRSILG